jgi:hypothetical protein
MSTMLKGILGIDNTGLEPLFRKLRSLFKLPNLVHPEGFQQYSNVFEHKSQKEQPESTSATPSSEIPSEISNFHNAGYDALITGIVFSILTQEVENKRAEAHKNDQST